MWICICTISSIILCIFVFIYTHIVFIYTHIVFVYTHTHDRVMVHAWERHVTGSKPYIRQNSAALVNTLQTATRCNTLQHTQRTVHLPKPSALAAETQRLKNAIAVCCSVLQYVWLQHSALQHCILYRNTQHAKDVISLCKNTMMLSSWGWVRDVWHNM